MSTTISTVSVLLTLTALLINMTLSTIVIVGPMQVQSAVVVGCMPPSRHTQVSKVTTELKNIRHSSVF